MHRARNDIVAGLAKIDVVIGMYRLIAPASAKELSRTVRDYLLGLHIRLGAGASLENVHHELAVQFTLDDSLRRFLDGLRNPRRQQAQGFIGRGRMLLNHPQGPNKHSRKTQRTYWEILKSPRRLGAIIGIRRH